MYRKEVNLQSPLRILEQSIHGGLGKGNLGVLMSRAGVGKTACLVQIGLDDLMQQKKVLHIALDGQTVDQVREWYDSLFADLAKLTELQDRRRVKAQLAERRIIQAHAGRLTAERFEHAVALFAKHMNFKPEAILVDGFDWEADEAVVRDELTALKASAMSNGAELWMTARTHREDTGPHPQEVTPPCSSVVDLIDVALLLEPQADHVTIRLMKDHDHKDVATMNLELQPDTMRVVVVGKDRPAISMPAESCTLLSGGARGAEATFGECAEKWGLNEVNFSFAGREQARTRGVRVLTAEELEAGAVSALYLTTHMHRTYPDTPLFRQVLQSIWHQVNTARSVFVVGRINDDDTVKGGTGWAAELAKHLEKPLWVFDQERGAWFHWTGSWTAEEAPTISYRRFTGTGSRFLNDAGKKAIHDLFERSFGGQRT